MESTARLKYLRIAPRKTRLVADMIRGLTVVQAEQQLRFLAKRAASPMEKLLKSAVANAENNAKMVKDNLYISQIIVDEGPTLKRWRARARGSAAEILKRTSHITLTLKEIQEGVRKEKQAQKTVKEEIKEKKKTGKKQFVKEDKKLSGPQNVDSVRKIFRRKSI